MPAARRKGAGRKRPALRAPLPRAPGCAAGSVIRRTLKGGSFRHDEQGKPTSASVPSPLNHL